mmetsp:Transcript_39060/g.87348  ORF Transcript_39060/g.87348 Transcript_39060/m.87348 type:complete len:1924 (+) Transcript_39060:98-5869(+)
MGVPKFYRWLSERYPKINQIISDLMLMPEFDNLYLDMNGIIHHCTHPNDDDLAAALSDKDVMLGMFNYIDRIVSQIAKPRKFLFMAIDGVAPRAKLNQQRSRRFASAKDREAARLAAEQKGEVVDASAVFDSNCITPGTEFMQRVSEHLQYFIRKKQSEDPVWRRLTVVFSGHEVPGEGEHKIMQAIREIREAEGYDPNTTHCMYGQDADLIMLGLVTHEPHFTLLREVINFNQNRRPARNEPKNAKTLVKQTSTAQFQLLHISVLREYLQMELCQGLYRQQIPVSIERVIDDFVFMTFLVGNDFLPHLPSLDISEGAFDKLFAVYTSQMEDAARATGSVEGGYLTKSGSVPSLGRLERFLEVIGSMEDDIFKERAANEAEFAARRRKWERRDGGVKSEELSPEEEAAVLADREATFTAALHRARLEEQVQAGAGKAGAGAEAGAGPHLAQGTAPAGFELTKALYYFEKLGITPLHARVHRAIRLRYLEGLLWCLAYYYRGCISWGWFYPFHYGPMMSDMVGLDGLSKELRFDKGAPFKPFEQLLGCLPAASSQFLPAPYRKLMTTSSSPIADFYPADFRVDMNGKRNPWEGVNLLPFIDAQRMRVTLAQLCPPDCLTPAETKRNSFGDPIEFVYDSSPAFEGALHKSCNPAMGLPDLAKCKVRARSRKDMPFDRTDIVFKPEVKVGCVMPWPGFPSLHALPIPAAEIRPLKVNCFGSDSRYSTLTLVLPPIDPGTLPPTAHLAASTIGRSVFVNWPMMHEARVVSVSDAKHEYVLAPQTGPSGDPSGPSGGGPTQASKSAASSGVARSGPLGKYLHGLSGGGGTRGKGTRGKSKSPVEVDGVRLEITALSEEEGKHWKFQASDLRDEYLKGRGVPGQGGVDIGPVFARFTVAPLQGMKRDPRTGARSKVFAAASGESLADLPLQLAIWTDPSPDPRFLECGALGPTELAPLGSSAVVVASELPKEKPGAANGDESGLWPLHGAMGTVVGHDGRTVSLRVLKLPREPPFGLGIAAKVADMYFPTGAVARTLGLRPDILGRLLGSLVVAVDRNESYDLGLRLRASEPPPTKGAPRGPTLRVLGYLRQGQSQAPGSTGKGGKGGKQGACSQAAQAVEAGEAWVSERDSVRVVGSAPKAAAEKADAAQDKGAGWELSVKAVQLVQAYMQTFPRLFALLNATGSSDRFFSMGALFPPSPGATPGEVKTSREQLAEVVGWLDELEVSRLPRAPLSTHALASDAVKAIQKAADARQAALGAKQGELRFEVLHGLPLECLALAPSPNGQRDVKANYNQAMDPPVLGDRCLNAHDSGVPFGLRGTVVAIHFHSSAVEVVFDEQFVGGSSLQGSCDKFRGRLVPWRHLLKLPPAVPSAQTKQAVPEGAAAAKAEGKAEPSKMTPSEYIAEQKKKKKDAKKNEMRKAGAAAAAAVAEEEEEEEDEGGLGADESAPPPNNRGALTTQDDKGSTPFHEVARMCRGKNQASAVVVARALIDRLTHAPPGFGAFGDAGALEKAGANAVPDAAGDAEGAAGGEGETQGAEVEWEEWAQEEETGFTPWHILCRHEVSKDEVAILAREESEAQELAAAHERACALALAKGQEPPPLNKPGTLGKPRTIAVTDTARDVLKVMLSTEPFRPSGTAPKRRNLATPDDDGQTCLQTALTFGNLEMARLLLEWGEKCDLGMKQRSTQKGRTSLLMACNLGLLKEAEAMLALGARVNEGDKRGNTPLIAACRIGVGGGLDGLSAQAALRAAADRGLDESSVADAPKANDEEEELKASLVELLLLEAKADPNQATTDGDTALHFICEQAASVTQASTAKALLKAGADPGKVNLRKDTPLHVAVENLVDTSAKSKSVVSLLLDAIGKSGKALAEKNRKRRTPYEHAVNLKKPTLAAEIAKFDDFAVKFESGKKKKKDKKKKAPAPEDD